VSLLNFRNATEQGLAKKALARAIEGGAKIGTESMAWTAPRAIAEASLETPKLLQSI
jgi:hypothetical protein